MFELSRWLRKFVVVISIWLLSSNIAAGGEFVTALDIGEAEQEFLIRNSQIISFDDGQDLSLLKPYLDDTVVYLSGEIHQSRGSKEWEFFLLKYLHREAGVRVLLAELPYSVGYLINQYVNGGEPRVSIQWHAPAIREFFSRVRSFNLDLPLDQRIRVVGIEAEFSLELPVSLLEELLRENQMDDFWRVIRGLEQGRHISSVRETKGLYASLAQRDRYSYLNFVTLYEQLEGTRFFGQWGACHVYQREYNQVAWLGANLNSPDSPVAGKVLTIQCGHSGTFTSEGFYPFLQGGTTTLRKLSGGDVTLFRLTGEESPFEENLYLIPRNTGGVTTDYMQFLAYFGALAPEE